jgi:formiminoglutamase
MYRAADRFQGENFVEFASQGNQCSAVHAQYITEHKGKIVWLSDIKKVRATCPPPSKLVSTYDLTGRVYKLHIQSGKTAGELFASILDDLGQRCEAIFVSFDIDSIKSSDCPVRHCSRSAARFLYTELLITQLCFTICQGVSAPGAVGLTSEDALEICFVSGKNPKVPCRRFYCPTTASSTPHHLLYIVRCGWSTCPNTTLLLKSTGTTHMCRAQLLLVEA